MDELEDSRTSNINKPAGWGSRHTMAILGFFAFAMSYAMRFNISIAIVSMVNQTYATQRKMGSRDLSMNFSTEETITCGHLKAVRNENENETSIYEDAEGEFLWDHTEQGVILGSFFWGYVVTQLPAGILAHHFGGKWPMGLGLFLSGIATLLTPMAANFHKYALCFVRVVCGLGEGFAFPCMHRLVAAWAPPNEKSILASIIYAGAQFGTAATMVVGGYLIHGNVLGGWPAIFYVTGGLTVVWFVLWTFLVYDNPAEHPRISLTELNYIEKSIGTQASKTKVPIPWRAIFTSMPFWAIMIGHFGHGWGLYNLLIFMPSYLKSVLHFDIKSNSWLSALPYILMWIASLFSTQIADLLISRKILRTVAVRKACQSIAHIGSAVLLIAASYSGCSRFGTVTLLTLSVAVNGAIYGGYVVNHVDIARNHAHVLSGITHTFANLTGFLVPMVTGFLLNNEPSLENWQLVFFIAAAIYIIDVIFYCIFASGSEQPWNRGYTHANTNGHNNGYTSALITLNGHK